MIKSCADYPVTAETEAADFEKIYNLEVVVVPTNQLLIRHEYWDVVYRTEREKFNAVIEEIKEFHLRGEPVLVGTIAIEKSERLSAQLRKSSLLPARLQEIVKEAGLEGPRPEKWMAPLAARHSSAPEWVVRAGTTASTGKKLLGEKRYQSLRSSPNGNPAEFM